MKVKKLMRLKPKTVNLNTPIKTVWQLVSLKQIHMVPVLSDNKSLMGIITAEDLLINLVPDYREFFSDFYPTSPTIDDVEEKITKQLKLTAADVMNPTVYTVYYNHDIFKALSRMLAYNKRILPVVDKRDHLMGFIVEKDIFKYLFQKQKNILKKIKARKKSSKKNLVKQKKKPGSKSSNLIKSLKTKSSSYVKLL